jgi:hypothetical protein|tara:strand:- start:1511 stop:1660 length:150 start_codon:yes stop_codon:yes gene_type:complete
MSSNIRDLNKVIKALEKASKTHARQAKMLDKIVSDQKKLLRKNAPKKRK